MVTLLCKSLFVENPRSKEACPGLFQWKVETLYLGGKTYLGGAGRRSASHGLSHRCGKSDSTALTSGALTRNRAVGPSDISHVMVAFPYHQLLLLARCSWCGQGDEASLFLLHSWNKRSPQHSVHWGRVPFHYLWIIHTIAFVGLMFLKTMYHNFVFVFPFLFFC